jgi:hypothetical protein
MTPNMNKKIYVSAMLLSCTMVAFSQVRALRNLGPASEFVKRFHQVAQVTENQSQKSETYSLPTPSGSTLPGIVYLKSIEEDATQIAGSAGEKGSFSLRIDQSGRVTGTYTSIPARDALNIQRMRRAM